MHRLLMGLLLVGLIAGQAGIGTTAYFTEAELNADNTFQAWVSSQWVQTTQGDFQAGVLDNVDTSSSPGDVKLEIVLQEPTTSVGSEESWYFTSWSCRAPVTISNPGSGLTDYQVRVDVTYDADMQPDFDDIRFVDSDDSSELSHWRESYIDSTSAVFWVKVPSSPSGDKTIYMYYGNDAVSSASDGDATFAFFDDFPGTTLDASKWQSAGIITVAGSEVHIYCNADGQGIGVVIPDYLFGLGYSVEYRERFGETNVVHLIQGAYQLYDAQHHATVFSALADGTGRARTANDSVITETILGLYDTSYHRYQITRISGEAKYYYEGILLATHTTNVPPDDLRVQFTGDNTADIYLEWVFVRKYADPEPTTSIGTEDGWSRRAPVTISNPGSGLTDYQVKVDVNYDADMQPDFDDIRFKDSDGSTELSHWRESYTASTSAVFWVKVPSIPSGTKIIYMYYGNGVASSASDGDATFEFFDDFEDGDISDWSQYGSGTVQIANDGGNYVLLKTAYNDRNGGYSLFNNGALSNFEAVFRTKRINENGGSQNRYGIENGSFNGYGPRMQDFNSLPSVFAIERRNGGVGADLVSKSSSAYEWNTWMTVKFRRYGSTLEFELYDSSGSLAESISTSNSLYNSFDRFVVHGGWEFYTDDIRVRKYAPQSGYVSSGTIASQVLDTGVAGAKWDALFWGETLPSNTDITFEVRASNTSFAKNATTPSWTFVGGTSPITSGLPSGRYLQWRATLTTSDTSQTPTLHEVTIDYY
jgi:predicted ribosomally synthesized peptide with SipW-like signal peptide